MCGQPFIADWGKISKGQQPLLERGERCQVANHLPQQLHDRENQVAEGFSAD